MSYSTHVMKRKTIKKQISEYVAVFEPDDRAEGYTVTIPALPSCISEGNTFEEALDNIREAAELYLDVMGKKKSKAFLKKESRVIIAPVKIAY
jgi:antitoxin HicB